MVHCGGIADRKTRQQGACHIPDVLYHPRFMVVFAAVVSPAHGLTAPFCLSSRKWSPHWPACPHPRLAHLILSYPTSPFKGQYVTTTATRELASEFSITSAP